MKYFAATMSLGGFLLASAVSAAALDIGASVGLGTGGTSGGTSVGASANVGGLGVSANVGIGGSGSGTGGTSLGGGGVSASVGTSIGGSSGTSVSANVGIGGTGTSGTGGGIHVAVGTGTGGTTGGTSVGVGVGVGVGTGVTGGIGDIPVASASVNTQNAVEPDLATLFIGKLVISSDNKVIGVVDSVKGWKNGELMLRVSLSPALGVRNPTAIISVKPRMARLDRVAIAMTMGNFVKRLVA